MKQMVIGVSLMLLVFTSNAVTTALNFGTTEKNYILLIDASKSMESFDPNDLRQSTVRLFSAMLPKDSFAGVYQFSASVEQISPTEEVDTQVREKIKKASSSVHTKGIMSRLDLGLEFIITELGNQPGEKHAILLTDGTVDSGYGVLENQKLRKKIINKLVPLLSEKNIQVHIITPEQHSDGSLLKLISHKTQGVYQTIKRVDELNKAMMQVFDRTSYQDYQHYYSQEHFDVRDNATSATIIINEADASLILLDPEGREFHDSEHPEYIHWSVDPGYQMITIDAPIAGRWFIKSARELNSRVMILDDFEIKVSEIPEHIFEREHLVVNVALSSNGKIVSNQEILKYIRFNIVDRSGKEIIRSYRLTSKYSDGIYRANIVLDTAGTHEISIEAKSPSFMRSMHRVVKALPLPIKIDQKITTDNKQHLIEVIPEKKWLNPKRVNVEANITVKNKTTREILRYDKKQHKWYMSLSVLEPGQAYSIYFRINGVDESGRNFHVLTNAHLIYSELKMYVDMEKIAPQNLPHHLPLIYRLDTLSQEYIAKLSDEMNTKMKKKEEKQQSLEKEKIKKQITKSNIIKSDDLSRDFIFGTATGLLLIVIFFLYLSQKAMLKRKLYKEMNEILRS